MDGHFSDVQKLLKNRSKIYIRLWPTIKNLFKATTSQPDLRMHTTFKVVKQLNHIGSMKTFTEPSFNMRIEERLTILKNVCDECVTFMNKKQRYTGSSGTRQLSIIF